MPTDREKWTFPAKPNLPHTMSIDFGAQAGDNAADSPVVMAGVPCIYSPTCRCHMCTHKRQEQAPQISLQGRQMCTRHATYAGYQDVAMPKQNAYVSMPRYMDGADNAAIHQLGQLALLETVKTQIDRSRLQELRWEEPWR